MNKNILCILMITITFSALSQEKSSYYISIASCVNNSYNDGFLSNEIELGFRPKGSIFIPSISLGSIDFDNLSDCQFTALNIDLRYSILKKYKIRFKPYLGGRVSYYFLDNSTSINYKHLNQFIMFGPTLGFDFYLGKRFAVEIGYSELYEINTGLTGKISLGLRFN